MAHKKAKSNRASVKADSSVWLIVAGIAALALFLFSRSSSAAAASGSATGGTSFVNIYQNDPATGAYQFDSNLSSSTPPGQPLTPLNDPVSGAMILQPPSGYTLWRDVATGNYFYFPNVSIA